MINNHFMIQVICSKQLQVEGYLKSANAPQIAEGIYKDLMLILQL